jgi:peptide/nickel transport system permease protein
MSRQETKTKKSSTILSSAQKRRANKLVSSIRRNTKAKYGLVLIVLLLTTAALGPVVIAESNANQIQISNRFEPPSVAHPFGTDNVGRDLFLRVTLGARISVYVGTLSVLLATLFGVPLGAVASYSEGNLDDLIMRVMDVMMSFPPILFAMVITAILGPNLTNTLIAIGIVYTPYFARVTRSEVITVSKEDFVDAARAIGENDRRILFTEVLPNALAPIIVQASISMGYAIIAAASLSFLGLGAQPPTPSWGLMISDSRQYLVQAPWMAIFPGLGIGISVIGFNMFGDGMRDILDPTVRTE